MQVLLCIFSTKILKIKDCATFLPFNIFSTQQKNHVRYILCRKKRTKVQSRVFSLLHQSKTRQIIPVPNNFSAVRLESHYTEIEISLY